MNDMLSDRAARCAGFGCPNALELPDNRPAAVKTGTTNDGRDAWTIGYTPQLVTGVWLGNSDDREMENVPGEKGAAPVWRALMAWALAEEPAAVWRRPSGLIEMAVCDPSGLLPTEFCPTVTELFIAGTQPTLYDNIYQAFAVNRETGRLATLYTPPELVENRVYQIYPEEAAEWARENGVEAPPTEFDTITQPGNESRNARIFLPQNFAVVDGEVAVWGTAAGDNFSFYRLAYFEGLTPDNLQTIVDAADKPVTNNVLGVWDTSGLNGLYTLLLTVVGEDGRFEETSVHVTVENK
jgi:membrane carboxypeptidase/penicillin-binding protein PbpC